MHTTLPKVQFRVIGLAALLVFSSCTNDPKPEFQYDVPIAKKGYDGSKGGVQIIQVAYDEEANGQNIGGWGDEFLVLESDTPRSIRRWTLRGGNPRKEYSLTDSIAGVLTVYTHSKRDTSSQFQYGLDLPSDVWLWRNVSPDTARLYDANHELVDSLGY